MTTIDAFAYPAENETAAGSAAEHAATAKELVERADEKLLNADCHSEPAAQIVRRESAMRDVEMAKVVALLAVNATLTDIAGSLRMLAKTPAALDLLADHVSAAGNAVQDVLTELGSDVCDVHTAIEDSTGSVGSAVRSVTAAVDGLAETIDRPRWWQRRRRRQSGSVLVADEVQVLLDGPGPGLDIVEEVADTASRGRGA